MSDTTDEHVVVIVFVQDVHDEERRQNPIRMRLSGTEWRHLRDDWVNAELRGCYTCLDQTTVMLRFDDVRYIRSQSGSDSIRRV